MYYVKGDDIVAAQSTKMQTALVLKYKDGVDGEGKDIIKSQKFSNVKTSATDDQIYGTALEVQKLTGKDMDEIVKIDQNSITG